MTNKLKISFVVAFRDRDIVRVKRSLDSLEAQGNRLFELIFIDYGSQPAISNKVKALVNSYKFVRYIYSETRGRYWNKAHALNTGMRFTTGDVVAFTDIDLIYPTNFIDYVQQNLKPDQSLSFDAYYLPGSFDFNNFAEEPISTCTSIGYIGLCIAMKSHFENISGYDEFFMIWGAEDVDIDKRLEKNGCKKRRISVEELPLYHQWHPPAFHLRPRCWYNVMIAYYYHSFNCPNNNSRGALLRENDRPALNAYRDGAYKAHRKIKLDDRPELAFLGFWNVLENLGRGELAWFEYVQPPPIAGRLAKPVKFINSLLERQRLFNYRLVYNLLLRQGDTLVIEHVKDFIQFFVGVNRHVLDDYYIESDKTRMLLIIVKASI